MRTMCGDSGAESLEEVRRPAVWDQFITLVKYLQLRPSDKISARRFYSSLLRACSSAATGKAARITVGLYLKGGDLCSVRVGRSVALARPGTDDLGILAGVHEPRMADWFKPRCGELVVDVGAHVGAYTIRAADAGARVLAFEPNPSSFRVLSETISRNQWVNVRAFQVALGSKSGTAVMSIPSGYETAASLTRAVGGRREEVNVRRLDDMVGLGEGESVDWLKIDAEGYELEVLAGGAHVLSRTRRLILEVDAPNIDTCKHLIFEEHRFRWVDRDPTYPGLENWFAVCDECH